MRFHARTSADYPTEDLPTPETVVIAFESRELVWHALGVSEPFESELPREYAPTVTTMMQEGDELEPLFGLILRFLSAVAFHYREAAWTTGFTAIREPDPMRPAHRREHWAGVGSAIQPGPRDVSVEDDDRLHLALALYREGRSANTKYLAFVPLWNVLQAAHDGNEAAVNAFINRDAGAVVNAPGGLNAYITSALKLPAGTIAPDVDEYLRFHGRDAIAHVIRRHATWTHINPNDLTDRFRLDSDTFLLHALARRAIDQRWPNAVTVTPRN